MKVVKENRHESGRKKRGREPPRENAGRKKKKKFRRLNI